MILKEKLDTSMKIKIGFNRPKRDFRYLHGDIYKIIDKYHQKVRKNDYYKNLYDFVRIILNKYIYFDNKNYYENVDIWEKVDDYFLENNHFNKNLKLTDENIKNIKQLSCQINRKIDSIINNPFTFSGFVLPDSDDNSCLQYNLYKSKLKYSELKKILSKNTETFLNEWKNGRVEKDFDLPLWNKIIAENFYYQISNKLIHEISDYVEGKNLYIHELRELGHPRGTIYWIMRKSDSINLIL